MKLVVGLGNPGRRYDGTRHNIGYMVAAELARRHGSGPARTRFQGQVVEAEIAGERALLLCPETYMNLSGGSVQEARAFYKLGLDELLVVCDDMHLPLGKLRLRASGSSGGQKGLENIILQLGSPGFARLRIGIGQPPEGWAWSDFVLSRFTRDDGPLIFEAVSRAADAVADWARQGIEYCMNRYN